MFRVEHVAEADVSVHDFAGDCESVWENLVPPFAIFEALLELVGLRSELSVCK